MVGEIVMKQFNLDAYLKNPSRKVITRSGRKARIICTDAKNDYPIIALVKEQYNDKEEIYTFTENGLWKLSPNKGLNDLFFAPEKKEGWVNIIKSSKGVPYVKDTIIFSSRESAETQGKDDSNYVSTVKIEWEE